MTELSMDYSIFISENKESCRDDWVYEYNINQVIEWDYIESAMSHGTVLEKCNFLIELNATKKKNRFVHK